MVGRQNEFRVALQTLRGPHADISREADEIQVLNIDIVEIILYVSNLFWCNPYTFYR